jgi:hypothetical protein
LVKPCLDIILPVLLEVPIWHNIVMLNHVLPERACELQSYKNDSLYHSKTDRNQADNMKKVKLKLTIIQAEYNLNYFLLKRHEP